MLSAADADLQRYESAIPRGPADMAAVLCLFFVRYAARHFVCLGHKLLFFHFEFVRSLRQVESINGVSIYIEGR